MKLAPVRWDSRTSRRSPRSETFFHAQNGTFSAPIDTWPMGLHLGEAEGRNPKEGEMTDEPAYRGEYPKIVVRPDGSELRIESLGITEPYGFAWGYKGTGPWLLAKAILLDHTSDAALSERDAKDFMLAVTSHLGAPSSGNVQMM